MGTERRLTKAFESAKVIPYDPKKRYVIMSDCHRGVGNWGDNFSNNQNIFFAALKQYYKEDYTYIEIGDGDELWENHDMEQIVQVHSDVFWLMSKFYKENRLYMLYGNHDVVKKSQKFCHKNMQRYYCDSTRATCPLFPEIEVYEGIILEDQKTSNKIFMTHGHQGDFINDTVWWLGRFLVRYVWRTVELLGMKDPTSSYVSDNKKNVLEMRITKWAEERKQITIAGHTHRPAFPMPGESFYFNDGCCIHPRCITGIEINQGRIVLVKWSVMTRDDGVMYVGKTILEGPVPIERYFQS